MQAFASCFSVPVSSKLHEGRGHLLSAQGRVCRMISMPVLLNGTVGEDPVQMARIYMCTFKSV